MDIDRIVDTVTKVILQRLNGMQPAADSTKIVTFGDIPDGMISADYQVRKGRDCGDIDDCGYIVMSAKSFRSLHGIATEQAPCPQHGRVVNLCEKRLVHERDLREHNVQSDTVVMVGKKAIITALAFDYVKSIGAKIQKE